MTKLKLDFLSEIKYTIKKSKEKTQNTLNSDFFEIEEDNFDCTIIDDDKKLKEFSVHGTMNIACKKELFQNLWNQILLQFRFNQKGIRETKDDTLIEGFPSKISKETAIYAAMKKTYNTNDDKDFYEIYKNLHTINSTFYGILIQLLVGDHSVITDDDLNNANILVDNIEEDRKRIQTILKLFFVKGEHIVLNSVRNEQKYCPLIKNEDIFLSQVCSAINDRLDCLYERNMNGNSKRIPVEIAKKIQPLFSPSVNNLEELNIKLNEMHKTYKNSCSRMRFYDGLHGVINNNNHNIPWFILLSDTDKISLKNEILQIIADGKLDNNHGVFSRKKMPEIFNFELDEFIEQNNQLKT